MISYEQYSHAQDEVYKLSMLPSLSTREVQKQNGLLALLASCKGKFSPEEVRNGERERLHKEAGLPRDFERARRRIPESVDREYRDAGLGRSVRLTHVPDDLEARANLAGTESITYQGASTTGRIVPWGIWGRFLETAKHADDLFQEWTHFSLETDSGNPTSVPSADDVSKQSVQVSEGVQSSESDVANFGTMALGAWSFRTGRVVVSRELIQDSNYPLADVLEMIFAKRHARGVGQALVSGTGVSSPTGLLTAAVASGGNVTVAVGSSVNDGSSLTGANSIGTDDLINVMQGLDPAYWPGAIWAMHPATLLSLWGQKDKMGRPIVDGSILSPGGMPTVTPLILGKAVAVCPSMPKIQHAANSVVLYHPDYFFVRSVPSSMFVRVFQEAANLVENDAVAFESFYRVDANLSVPNGSFAPVSVLANHS
jgi:HK97 family phage major capsid protein